MTKTFTMQRIAEVLDGELIGDGSLTISRLAHPADSHSATDLVLAMDVTLLPLLAMSKARAAVLSAGNEPPARKMDASIVVQRPRVALARLTTLFAEPVPVLPGIHPTAIIEDDVILGANVTIGAQTFVGKGSRIGDHSVLHPQVYIGPGVALGSNALVYSGARIGHGVVIGNDVIVHFNASVGADGFSFVTPQIGSVEAAKATGTVSATNSELIRIASLGTVIISDSVEIGANTSIDRGTIAATRIGRGTKIDNQVQIGHNVVIGENCMICGRVGIAGSCTIGDRVVLGGAVGIADHVKVGDDSMAMAMSGVAGHILPRTIVGGIPAMPRQRLTENLFNISRIKHLLKKMDALTTRIDVLEQRPKND